MTQEDKTLLLQDLCARLPYHPTVKIYNDSWEGCMIGEFDNCLYYHHLEAFSCDRIEIKPFLRPLYSLTEEEKKEFYKVVVHECGDIDNISPSVYVADWQYSKHLDVHGLIPKGLAIEVTEENNPYEN